jgi:receptor protein-tyrosine kinase
VVFADLLNSARASFDVVIVDTPGLSEGYDAILVAARAGAALAVARSRHTRVDAFRSMLAEMKAMGVQMTGTVLNDIPAHRAAAS